MYMIIILYIEKCAFFFVLYSLILYHVEKRNLKSVVHHFKTVCRIIHLELGQHRRLFIVSKGQHFR